LLDVLVQIDAKEHPKETEEVNFKTKPMVNLRRTRSMVSGGLTPGVKLVAKTA